MLERINWRRKPLSLLAFLNDAKFIIHFVTFFSIVYHICALYYEYSTIKFTMQKLIDHYIELLLLSLYPCYKSCLACLMPIWISNASFQRNIIFFTFHRQIGWISKEEHMVAILHFCNACYGFFVFGIKHVYSCTLQFVLCDYSIVFFATFFLCSCNTSNKNFTGVNKVVNIVVTTITSAKVPIFYETKAKIWCSKNASFILGQGLVIVI